MIDKTPVVVELTDKQRVAIDNTARECANCGDSMRRTITVCEISFNVSPECFREAQALTIIAYSMETRKQAGV